MLDSSSQLNPPSTYHLVPSGTSTQSPYYGSTIHNNAVGYSESSPYASASYLPVQGAPMYHSNDVGLYPPHSASRDSGRLYYAHVPTGDVSHYGSAYDGRPRLLPAASADMYYEQQQHGQRSYFSSQNNRYASELPSHVSSSASYTDMRRASFAPRSDYRDRPAVDSPDLSTRASRRSFDYDYRRMVVAPPPRGVYDPMMRVFIDERTGQPIYTTSAAMLENPNYYPPTAGASGMLQPAHFNHHVQSAGTMSSSTRWPEHSRDSRPRSRSPYRRNKSRSFSRSRSRSPHRQYSSTTRDSSPSNRSARYGPSRSRSPAVRKGSVPVISTVRKHGPATSSKAQPPSKKGSPSKNKKNYANSGSAGLYHHGTGKFNKFKQPTPSMAAPGFTLNANPPCVSTSVESFLNHLTMDSAVKYKLSPSSLPNANTAAPSSGQFNIINEDDHRTAFPHAMAAIEETEEDVQEEIVESNGIDEADLEEGEVEPQHQQSVSDKTSSDEVIQFFFDTKGEHRPLEITSAVENDLFPSLTGPSLHGSSDSVNMRNIEPQIINDKLLLGSEQPSTVESDVL